MKRIILAFTLGIPLISFADHSEKSIPEWYTENQVKDPKIGTREAVLEMHFALLDYGYEAIGQDSVAPPPRIVYALNGKMDSMDFPKNGMIDLKVVPGKYIGQFYAGPNYYEVKTDSFSVDAGFRRPLHINFKTSIHPIIEDKPVIYIYSDQPQPVSVQMNISGKMGFTYPAYHDGWNFIADRDGNLYMNGKTYPYLFWEAETTIDYSDIDWENGSIVSRDSLVSFFEKDLSAMGLNDKEISDYITYWVPRMMKYDSTYVHFLVNDDYEDYASMDVTPVPDSKFQVFMLWTSASGMNASDITPQDLETFSRKGLTVLEWGGGELPSIPVIFDAKP